MGWRRPLGGPSPSTFCVAAPLGVNEVDYCQYPVRETQLQWLRYYLQAQKGMAVTSREVERLYVQVNKFALVSACDWEEAGEGGARRRDSDSPPLLLTVLWRRKQSPGSCVRAWGFCFPYPTPQPVKSRFFPSWRTASRKESSFLVFSSL